MDSIEDFLAHAVKLEEDAALRFSDLAETMRIYGNTEVAAFFAKMAEFSRLHLAEARARCGFRDVPKLDEAKSAWAGDESPEAASMAASHYLTTVEQALDAALESERAGLAFYSGVAASTSDPEIRSMAQSFAEEEAEHVVELERWRSRYPAAA
ncbi:ferritin family protein [Azospirillum sp. TSO22-1]|uniref:ferritin-like domain-containing protein n=1 Tax=Azospirillum sp. TSO22-1 TaxID=716789 RepID=UPI000D60A398|nr:ferritin family protein [Azospirillum sp. TSO22-1]PWC55815.1 rubrerythrin [Azospirillum sp. TSO22-1]